jgi:hypothetical protein
MIGTKKILIILLLVYAVNAAGTYNYTSIEAHATVCNNTPYLNITSFSTTSPAYSDSPVTIYVTTKNEGNCYNMNNVTLNVSIYNAFGVQVYNSSQKSTGGHTAGNGVAWTFGGDPTAVFPTGSYEVNVTAWYSTEDFSGNPIFNSSTNSSVNMTVSTRPVTPPSGGGGGGGGGALPPSIPSGENIQFQKQPILQEVSPGGFMIVDMGFKNPENKTQSIDIEFTGVPESWINLFSKNLTIGPDGVRTASFTLSVPENADSGDYLVRASITRSGQEQSYSYFILRVKSYPSVYAAPQIYRKVDIDFVNNKTSVTIIIENDASPHRRVEIYEKIPKVIADHVDKVTFHTAPSSIIQADPLVMFALEDMRPDERRSVQYTVNNVIDQYEPYVYWPIEQVNIMYEKGVEKIQISNIYQSILVPGRHDNYLTFDIGNIHTSSINVTISSWLPKGWNTTPASINLLIPPHSQTNVLMNVYAPETIQPGNYYAGLYITYENMTITKELVFRITDINALGGLFAGLRLLYDNGYLVLLAVSVLVIMVIRVVRTRRRYEYKEDVSDTLSEIKGIVFRRK